MKRILIGLVACAVLACVNLAWATDLSQTAASVALDLPETNSQFKDQVNTAVSRLTITDVPAIVAEVNQRTQLDVAVAASSVVTNGQAVTLSGVVMQLNSSGGANNGTNTITFANGEAGRVFIFSNVGTSNNLAVALTGNYSGTALNLAPADSAIVWFVATNSIYGIESK